MIALIPYAPSPWNTLGRRRGRPRWPPQGGMASSISNASSASGWLAGGADRQRDPVRVGHDVAFAALFPTVGGVWPGVCPPFSARTKALSITARSRLIRPCRPSMRSSAGAPRARRPIGSRRGTVSSRCCRCRIPSGSVASAKDGRLEHQDDPLQALCGRGPAAAPLWGNARAREGTARSLSTTSPKLASWPSFPPQRWCVQTCRVSLLSIRTTTAEGSETASQLRDLLEQALQRLPLLGRQALRITAEGPHLASGRPSAPPCSASPCIHESVFS